MDQELREHIAIIEQNQRTIQAEVIATHNEVLRTYRDLDEAFARVFKRLTELENQIKRR